MIPENILFIINILNIYYKYLITWLIYWCSDVDICCCWFTFSSIVWGIIKLWLIWDSAGWLAELELCCWLLDEIDCNKLGRPKLVLPERARTFSPTLWIPATIALEAIFPALLRDPVRLNSVRLELNKNKWIIIYFYLLKLIIIIPVSVLLFLRMSFSMNSAFFHGQILSGAG